MLIILKWQPEKSKNFIYFFHSNQAPIMANQMLAAGLILVFELSINLVHLLFQDILHHYNTLIFQSSPEQQF